MNPAPKPTPEIESMHDDLSRQPTPQSAALAALRHLREAAEADAPPPLSPDEVPPIPEDLVKRLEERFAPIPTPSPEVDRPASKRIQQRENLGVMDIIAGWLHHLFTPSFGLACTALLIVGVAVTLLNQDQQSTQPVLRGGGIAAVTGEVVVILVGTSADQDAFSESWDGDPTRLVETAEKAVTLAKELGQPTVIIADAIASTLTVIRSGKPDEVKPVEQVLPDQLIGNLVLAVQTEIDAMSH